MCQSLKRVGERGRADNILKSIPTHARSKHTRIKPPPVPMPPTRQTSHCLKHKRTAKVKEEGMVEGAGGGRREEAHKQRN